MSDKSVLPKMNSKLVASSTFLCLIVMLKINGNDAELGLTVPNGNIDENSPVGTTVATLVGSGGTTTTYTFAVTPSTVFEITGANLTLKAGVSLDYETMPTYTLVITVAAANETSVDANFTVTVNDVNEVPMFAMTTYSFSVNHMAGEGTVIGTVTATDVDAGVNGDIASYTFSDGNNDTVFTVGTDGMIKIATGEYANATSQTAYVLTYKATDGGDPALSYNTKVSIGVSVCAGVARLVGGLTGIIWASAVLVANLL